MKRKNQMYDKINVYICALFSYCCQSILISFAHDEEASVDGAQ